MSAVQSILTFCKEVLLITGSQILAIFGVFFFFGLLLYILARFTRNSFVKSIGQSFDVYFTGWIGTLVHELGHAIFCIPFGHKIIKLSLFNPKAGNGSLGYVNHSYNARNIWHQLGNFFIGFGPILFGSLLIYILMQLLLPNNESLLQMVNKQVVDFSSWEGFKGFLLQILPNASRLFMHIFSSINLQSWSFYLFLYLALSISSHMELSPSDLKGLGSGFIYLFVVLFVINILLKLLQVDAYTMLTFTAKYTNLSAGVLMLSTFLSAFFFTFSFLLLNIYTLIRYKKTFHPFA